MSFYESLGIDRYINAHDTRTVYGASRMSKKTLSIMEEAAAHFVDIYQMQRILGEAIAKMTKNEGAYITNGAAGAIKLVAAICMVGDSRYSYTQLPNTTGLKNEIIVIRCQRNSYDVAIRASGAKLVEIGNADDTFPYELEGSINEKTAAIFYFLASTYAKPALSLNEVIQIAKKANIPVIVDAAAQLPPVENLWEITKMGADLVIFSGGKTLCGPQESGLILGKKEFIKRCLAFGAPNNGICRDCKTSRESMAGLYAALQEYLALDQKKVYEQLEKKVLRLGKIMEKGGLKTELVPFGPVGQTYPRIFGQFKRVGDAENVVEAMKKHFIYIGHDFSSNSIYISPLNLSDADMEKVESALQKCLQEKEL
jgi:L-seryl-tRNA(Ser) seleniumtransferase